MPQKFANGGAPSDLAAAIAAAINPLIQTQLDEARVQDLIDAKMQDLGSYIEAKLQERLTVHTFEIKRPDGITINVGRQHKQFVELLSWVEAGCFPLLREQGRMSRFCATSRHCFAKPSPVIHSVRTLPGLTAATARSSRLP